MFIEMYKQQTKKLRYKIHKLFKNLNKYSVKLLGTKFSIWYNIEYYKINLKYISMAKTKKISASKKIVAEPIEPMMCCSHNTSLGRCWMCWLFKSLITLFVHLLFSGLDFALEY